MYVPGEPRSKREKVLRNDGRYVCRPCEDLMVQESTEMSMEATDGCMYFVPLLLTHTDVDFFDKIRLALKEKYSDVKSH
jgi:hypothetical protein